VTRDRLQGLLVRFAVTILRVFASLLLALTALPVLGAESIRVVETHAVSGEPPSGTAAPSHELRPTLYLFQGARWLPDEAVTGLWEAMELLEPCGIVLAGAELQLLDAPRKFHSYSTPVSRELLRGMAVAKPAIFFVDDTKNRPAYDAEAVGRGNAATRPELADTVWVAYGARDLSRVLAHELVHLLSDSGEHSVEAGNLMQTDTAPENTRLTDAQCQRLRTRGEANGLLVRR